MTVNGYDGEVTAYLMRSGATLSVYMGYVYPDNTAYASNAQRADGSWSTTITSDVPTMLDGTVYIPVSMTVGDFDNDGYKNEIAVAYSDRAAVRYVVLQATQTSSSPIYSGFALNVLNNGDVGSYNYNTYYEGFYNGTYDGYGGQMDGLTAMYSVATATGDFDGDGQSEFAVVWRDTTPNNFERFSMLPATSYFLFVGYTGKIHVKTYKWNGGGYSTEEDVQAFDAYSSENDSDRNMHWNNLDLPLGVKATAGDFDGDGRDDIAVLRIMLQCSEYYNFNDDTFWYSNFVFGGFVDWYTFNSGSIHPNYRAHSWEPTDPTTVGSQPPNYGVNQNGWVGIRSTGNMWLGRISQIGIDVDNEKQPGTQNQIRQIYYVQPLTGAQDAYPIIDREFDIIAGKFSGRIGNVDNMIICDDLVIKYPQWSNSDGNKLRSHVALMTNIPGTTNWGTQVNEITSLSDRNHLLAFTKGDYLNESVTLGDPVKTVDRSDLDYTAILQMMPYHVDNITPDGRSLTRDPQNFTLRLDTAINYNNSSTESDTKSLEYSMTATAETIFALDSGVTRGASKTFQGIRGITSTFLGETPAGKALEGIGKFWDKMKDTVTTTKTTTNQNEATSMMSITTQANYLDTLYVNSSNRYLWRYPVENPPSWILERTLSNYGSFDQSQANAKQTYITFAMSEPAIPTATKGVNDSNYQPYHESGNLFSYPASLEQVEGYEGHTSLLQNGDSATKRWDGAAFNETITFINSTTDQESDKKTNKIGVITRFLSAIDNLFGTSFANIPYDTVSSFTRTVTDKESISVNIPVALSGAQFTTVFEPYLDVTGATMVAFAVESFRDIDALWGSESLYSKKPDPSFLLPEKFNCTALPQPGNQFAAFAGNSNDATAIRGRGIRYTVSDYDMETNNLLMNGLKYKIRIPVYNASFVNAPEFKVRLSYAKELKYNAVKTTIGEFTFGSTGENTLVGRGGGNHRQYAEFEWTPNVDQGIYYLFAEIDPEHKIDEVHEDRYDSAGNIVDFGANNMAYFKIGIASTDAVPFDRTQLETQYGSASYEGKFAAADINGSEFPFVEWVKADGLDFRDFIEQKVDGKTAPVTAEVEVKYSGEHLMTDAVLIGYALKPESSGKDVSEITDADMGLIFVKEHFALFPGEDHKLHFRINPKDLENGVGFLLKVYGHEYKLTDIIYGSSGTETAIGVGSASSGGCEAFSAGMAGVMALIFIMRKRGNCNR